MTNDDMHADWVARSASWVRNMRIYDAAFRPFTRAVLASADIGPGRRVLDVGCGAGTLLVESVAAGADTVGVDISSDMVDTARRRAPEAKVVTADAQDGDLLDLAPGAPFDRVISRFGVMFFDDPVKAFANIRSATAPGARLAFVCWREGETDMFQYGLRRLLDRLTDPPARPVPGEPGPLGLAHESRIRQVLTDAGWSTVAVDPLDGLCDFSLDGGDGVEERMAVALAGKVGQAARDEIESRFGADGWRAALDEVRAELRSGLVDGSVRFVSRVWSVTATNP